MVARCPVHGVQVELTTDRHGNLVERCEHCARRKAGRCVACGGPVIGQAVRCPSCNQAHRNRRANRRRARYCRQCGAPVTPGSKRQYCDEQCRRAGRNARARQRYWQREDWRKRKLAVKAAWRDSPAGRRSYVKQKRKGRLTGRQGYPSREAYLAAMREINARRREYCRAWAHEHQTRYVGKGEQPTCATCGAVVPWSGRGRPRKYCPPCHPWRRG